MKKKKQARKWIAALLIATSVVSLIFYVRMIPLWYYNLHGENKVSVAYFNENIKADNPYTREEIERFLYDNNIITMEDILTHLEFKKVRKTYQGYYAILHSTDGYNIFLFFNRWLLYKESFSCSSFVTREEAKNEIQELVYHYNGFYDYNIVPHYRLNTGAEYQVFFYSDGIDVVLYGKFEKMEGGEIMYLSKAIPLSYTALRWNPLYWFNEFTREIVYIKKVDRQ